MVVETLNMTTLGYPVESPSGTQGQSTELQKEGSNAVLHTQSKATLVETVIIGGHVTGCLGQKQFP